MDANDSHTVTHLLKGWQAKVTRIYAANDAPSRTSLWTHLRKIAPPPDKPWLVMGDINEVISSEEKSAMGDLNLHSSGLKEFCIAHDLVDIKSVGLFFTWTNNQEGLDSFLQTRPSDGNFKMAGFFWWILCGFQRFYSF